MLHTVLRERHLLYVYLPYCYEEVILQCCVVVWPAGALHLKILIYSAWYLWNWLYNYNSAATSISLHVLFTTCYNPPRTFSQWDDLSSSLLPKVLISLRTSRLFETFCTCSSLKSCCGEDCMGWMEEFKFVFENVARNPYAGRRGDLRERWKEDIGSPHVTKIFQGSAEKKMKKWELDPSQISRDS